MRFITQCSTSVGTLRATSDWTSSICLLIAGIQGADIQAVHGVFPTATCIQNLCSGYYSVLHPNGDTSSNICLNIFNMSADCRYMRGWHTSCAWSFPTATRTQRLWCGSPLSASTPMWTPQATSAWTYWRRSGRPCTMCAQSCSPSKVCWEVIGN